MTRARRRGAVVIGVAVLLAALLFVGTRSSRKAPAPPVALAPATSPAPTAAPAAPGPRTEREPALPGGAFAGRVLSAETGEGIAGAQGTLASETGAELTADTGAGGAFAIEPQAPGRYTVSMVSAPDPRRRARGPRGDRAHPRPRGHARRALDPAGRRVPRRGCDRRAPRVPLRRAVSAASSPAHRSTEVPYMDATRGPHRR